VRVIDLDDEEAAHARDRPLPAPDNVSREFWSGAARGELLFQRCPSCGHAQLYPRALCVRCGATPEWEAASGAGEVHTFTVIRQNLAQPFRELGPYVVAMIELAEGPRMMSNVTHVAPEAVTVGLEVTAYAVRVQDDLGIPYWRPVATGESEP
jgi:uncharacterized protein